MYKFISIPLLAQYWMLLQSNETKMTCHPWDGTIVFAYFPEQLALADSH